LLSAARRSSVGQVRKLLQEGADPDATDDDGQRPITVAVAADRADVVRLLLSAGASTADAGDWALVSIAAKHKAWDALRALLEAGVDVNASGRVGPGALEAAVGAGRLDLVRELLAAGADPNARANRDALEDAIAEGHEDIARALLDAGAKPSPASRKLASRGKRPADPKRSTIDFNAASQRPDFQAAMSAIEKRTNRRPKPMKQVAGVVYFPMPLKEARKVVLELQRDFLRRGCFLFVGEGGLGLAPTGDPCDIVAALKIRGEDPSYDSARIIRGLRDLARAAPFQILSAEWDSLTVRFDAKVAKPLAVARRILGFCPDFESAEPLARLLEKNNELTLWWD
jgi:hypothetical protein